MKRRARFAVPLIIILVAYGVVFGRALRQEENHLRITAAIPLTLISRQAIHVGDGTYLARTAEQFDARMTKDGFTMTSQMGAAFVLRKGQDTYVSSSRMYSSYFMLFSYPEKQ